MKRAMSTVECSPYRFNVLRVWVWHPLSTFPWTITEEITQLFPLKQALNGAYRVFPHQPITHVVSSWHTQPACLLKKNIHTPMQIQPMAGFFHYHVSVSHCKPSRNSNLFWHCCFDTSILQLVDMRQLELDVPLPKSQESLWPTMFSLAFWQRFWNYCWPVRACISKWCA